MAFKSYFNQKIYECWYDMKRRCEKVGRDGYENYGGRGIEVCSEWQNFHTFTKWAKTNGYKIGLEIDRIDNDGNYEPNNCRFVTRSENMRNTRNNVKVDGKLLIGVADDLGVNQTALLAKRTSLIKRGKPVTLKALLTNENEEKKIRVEGLTLNEIGKKYNRDPRSLMQRCHTLRDRKDEITIENLIIVERIPKHLVEGKTIREISHEYGVNYNTLRSRASTLHKRGIPLTLANVLNASNIYSISQSITTP